ncbi:MAG: DUF2628 domain-containing protein [Rhizobiaceae bacterium]|nr:DUF2628 domain-containing protein [Rhizobiaceae bacterium]
MARYVVMVPEGPVSAAGIDRARIVRDGFSFPAFIVPPLWLAWHFLWIEAAIAFAAMLGLGVLGETAGFGWAAPVLSLLVSLFVGLEGQSMRVARLSRRGWIEVAAIEADTLDDAELRFATLDADERPADRAEAPLPVYTAAAQPLSRTPRSAPGLLLSPGRG